MKLKKKSESKYLVPMSAPDITSAERQAVAAVLDTPHLSMGVQNKLFEGAVAEYTGRKHAIAVNSGTAGLHLCVRAMGISDGDLVITTPFSFVASSNVILYEGGIPVFVDVDARTGNIDIAQVQQAVDDILAGEAAKWLPRKGVEHAGELKAILPVDVFGQPVDFDPIHAIARGNDLKIIEDSCEAIGAGYKDRLVGKNSDAAVFAFYPNKQMTTGEGGIIVTDDDEAANLMRSLRNQGRSPGDTWLAHTHLGYNYRLDEMSAALGYVQLQRLDEMIAKRAQVAERYQQALAEIEEIETPKIAATTTKMSWFVYVVKVNGDLDRDGLIRALDDLGIPARPYFAPIHLQPFMVERFGYQPGDFPVTEDLGKRGIALPFSSVMTAEQVETVSAKLKIAMHNLKTA